MGSSPITDKEISLIKGMLDRKMQPSLIQAYFTRPDRLVNPARIQEIKNRTRGADVAAASNEEVNDFIIEYMRSRQASIANDDIPSEELMASRFEFRNGVIDSKPEGIKEKFNNSIIASSLYKEVRAKLVELSGLGGNVLAKASEPCTEMLDAMPENEAAASVIIVWMRANKLRGVLRSAKESSGNQDAYPLYSLEKTAIPLLEDVIESLNVFFSFSPELNEIEKRKTNSEQAAGQKSALEHFQPAAENAKNITSDKAYKTLTSQISVALDAIEDEDGRRTIDLANSSSRNFIIRVFEPIFDAVKTISASENFTEIMKKVRDGAAIEAGKRAMSNVADEFPAIVEYVKGNAGSILEFAQSAFNAEALRAFVESIISMLF